jgi:hypothetical protein
MCSAIQGDVTALARAGSSVSGGSGATGLGVQEKAESERE